MTVVFVTKVWRTSGYPDSTAGYYQPIELDVWRKVQFIPRIHDNVVIEGKTYRVSRVIWEGEDRIVVKLTLEKI